MRSFKQALQLVIILCLTGVAPLSAQVIEKKEKITLPVPPATSLVISNGQNVTYRSWQEIEINPETEIQQGAELTFEVLGLGTPPNNPDTNLNMNWILSRNFNGSGAVIGESKQFYNTKGRLLQTQLRNVSTGHVLANQVIYDQLDRPAINTLMAPTMNAGFNYKSDFVTTDTGGVYGTTNFEDTKLNTPDPVGNATPGTLGWYYSNNNTVEAYVPATGYPYNRIDFVKEGTHEVKRNAGIGEALKMGSGHEQSAFNMPVVNELSHYFQVRNKFFPGTEVGASPVNLINSAIQTVTRDANGREMAAIRTRDGELLMTARPGTAGLSVTNSFTVTPTTDKSSTVLNEYYFKLFSPSVVTITGAYSLYNMGGNEGQVSFSSGGTLAAGFYKLRGSTATSSNVITFTNSYEDITYNFYNQQGQLIASIAPEGVKKLLGTGINNYATKAALPFTTLYEYNALGRPKAVTRADGGKVEMVYRLDGSIRFSRNAVQQAKNAYSYTNYDQWGRSIESGEFTPAGGVAFNPNGMGIEESVSSDGGLGTGTRADWVKTVYDAPVSTGLTGYVQDDIFLNGGVSYMENASGAKTWYNYDDQGKVLWMVQDIPGLGKKTVDYTYDALGKTTKVVYQKGTMAETFVHYYEYDANQRLTAVYTNTTDNFSTKVQQAKYEYYLHGPLKRTELGSGVQGLDYAYTPQGWLKAINHGSRDLDPGKDGISGANAGFAKDAFGMNLEYYNGDYSRTNSGIGSIPLAATVADDQYTGDLKAMSWHSRKPQSVLAALGAAIENPTMYGFKYDAKYQLSAGTWGTPNYTSPAFTASNAFKEYNLAYDANGNIQTLARTGEAGTVTDNFTYSYQSNTNKLQSVNNGGTVYSSYIYNALGQLATETPGSGGARYIKYDVTGKVVGIYADAAFTQPKATFTYNERGQRIVKKDHVNNLTTYYVPDAGGQILAIYSQTGTGTISQSEIPVYASNRIGLFRRAAGVYDYEIADHLGTVRVVIDQNRNIKQYGDYYPFGYELRRGGSVDYRYGYQGQYSEKDPESGWYAYELRMYDSRIGRWLTMDPYNEFASPYVAMGNNLVNNVDIDGGQTQDPQDPEPVLVGMRLPTFEVKANRIITKRFGADFTNANKAFMDYAKDKLYERAAEKLLGKSLGEVAGPMMDVKDLSEGKIPGANELLTAHHYFEDFDEVILKTAENVGYEGLTRQLKSLKTVQFAGFYATQKEVILNYSKGFTVHQGMAFYVEDFPSVVPMNRASPNDPYTYFIYLPADLTKPNSKVSPADFGIAPIYK